MAERRWKLQAAVGLEMRIGWRHPLASLALLILIGLALTLLFPASASAQQQSLVVRPMKVEAELPPNRVARVLVNVRNQHPTRTEPVNLEVVHLTQARDGSLRIVTDEMLAEEMSPEEADNLREISSRDWIALPANRISISPGASEEIPVLIRVPPRSRGTFVSAVRIQTDEPEMPTGTGAEREAVFAIRFGFLVPFVNSIRGTAVRQNVSMAGISMEYDDGTDDEGNRFADPSTRVSMEIVNEGLTYSDLVGDIRVERRMGDQWRLVTTAELPRMKILPGITLELFSDLDRRLPSGEYRLVGNLAVDGTRTPRLEKTIDFEGDPDIDRIAFDTSLLLEPDFFSIVAVPGGSRANAVTVMNPSDQPISVDVTVGTPDVFSGKAMGDILGDNLSAAGWTDVRPNEFMLMPGQRRNIRVTSRLPREGAGYANYYADIVFAGRYDDGQSAGETRSLLHVRREAVENAPNGVIERLTLAESGVDGLYLAQLRFINAGNIHLQPTAMLQLLSVNQDHFMTRQMTSEAGLLLPMGIRDFAAELDLSNIEPGNYLLRATSDYGAGDRVIAEQVLTLREEVLDDEDGGSETRLHLVLSDPDADVMPDQPASSEAGDAVDGETEEDLGSEPDEQENPTEPNEQELPQD